MPLLSHHTWGELWVTYKSMKMRRMIRRHLLFRLGEEPSPCV